MLHVHGAKQSVPTAATGILEEEHRAIHRVVAGMAALADELERGADVKTQILDDLISFLRVFVDQCHHTKEDRWLFPILEAKGVPAVGCPVGALVDEHEKGRALAARLDEAVKSYAAQGSPARPSLIQALRELVELYPNHIWKEDYMLIPMANKVLSMDDQTNLLRGFEQVEEQLGPDVHDRMTNFPANLERTVLRLVEERGAGVAPVRTPEPTGSTALEFDLEDYIERLKSEQNWQAGRNSQTVVKYPDFRVVLTVLRAGSRLNEHQAAGPISVQTLKGHIRMRTGDRDIDLPAGRMLALNRGVRHDVEAVTDSAFLLTIAWPSSGRDKTGGSQ